MLAGPGSAMCERREVPGCVDTSRGGRGEFRSILGSEPSSTSLSPWRISSNRVEQQRQQQTKERDGFKDLDSLRSGQDTDETSQVLKELGSGIFLVNWEFV